MGTFRVTVSVGDPQGERYTPVEALVDTGATYTTLPGSALRALGVIPHEKGLFELADGSQVERDIGYTWIQIDGRTAIAPVVFAAEGSPALLGAVTLEIFRLAVDPVRQRLVPVRGLLMAFGRLNFSNNSGLHRIHDELAKAAGVAESRLSAELGRITRVFHGLQSWYQAAE